MGREEGRMVVGEEEGGKGEGRVDSWKEEEEVMVRMVDNSYELDLF